MNEPVKQSMLPFRLKGSKKKKIINKTVAMKIRSLLCVLCLFCPSEFLGFIVHAQTPTFIFESSNPKMVLCQSSASIFTATPPLPM